MRSKKVVPINNQWLHITYASLIIQQLLQIISYYFSINCDKSGKIKVIYISILNSTKFDVGSWSSVLCFYICIILIYKF